MNKKFYNFDLDDNILSLPTSIVLFHNENNKELLLTTKEFSINMKKIESTKRDLFVKEGNSFDLSKYQIRKTAKYNSFREFEDTNELKKNELHFKGMDVEREKEKFVLDISKAVDEELFSTSWKDFQEACATKSSSKATTIITARGQSPFTIYEGLLYLKKKNLIKFIPPIENLYPISHPLIKERFDPNNKYNTYSPAGLKMEILFGILDSVEKTASECSKSINYLCGFSDDDKNTVQFIKNKINNEKNKDRWPNLSLNIYFTKENKSQINEKKGEHNGN